MVKYKRNRLDFKRLRAATIEAIDSFSSEAKNDGLVEYLKAQAKQKPTAFLGLLLKIVQLNNMEEKQKKIKKITRIELVVPKDTFEDINNETTEMLE